MFNLNVVSGGVGEHPGETITVDVRQLTEAEANLQVKEEPEHQQQQQLTTPTEGI